jgi:hypothetical protein
MDNDTTNVEYQRVSESLITYPEKKVEREKNALGALQSAVDSHGYQEKVAPGCRLGAFTAPDLKRIEVISHKLVTVTSTVLICRISKPGN